MLTNRALNRLQAGSYIPSAGIADCLQQKFSRRRREHSWKYFFPAAFIPTPRPNHD
jgi:hypothetical protein